MIFIYMDICDCHIGIKGKVNAFYIKSKQHICSPTFYSFVFFLSFVFFFFFNHGLYVRIIFSFFYNGKFYITVKILTFYAEMLFYKY